MQRTPVGMITRQTARSLALATDTESGATMNTTGDDSLQRDPLQDDGLPRDPLQKERQDLNAEARAMRCEREVLFDMAEMLANLRNEVTQLRGKIESREPPGRQPRYSLESGEAHEEEPSPAPKITYREATDLVPIFDGYNIPLNKFVSACRQARDILPPNYERSLTRLLVAKLQGRARSAVADEPCDTVTQLIDLLVGTFGSIKNVAQYRGELTAIHLKAREHMLDYIDRVKELRSSIMDGERRARGNLNNTVTREIDELTALSFCNGLPTFYRLQLQPEHYHHPFEAFAAAKRIAKREELEKQWFETKSDRGDRQPSPRNVPMTLPPRYRSNEQHFSSPRPYDNYRGPPPSRPPSSNRRDAYREPPQFSYPPQGQYREQPRHTHPLRRQYREEPREIKYERIPHDAKEPTYGKPSTAEQPSQKINRNQEAREVWCQYCKARGHEIQECRKRAYYNKMKEIPGNERDPPRKADAPRADPSQSSRPVTMIDEMDDEKELNMK